jgi:stearoyl-CoA desaturase (delta-9 desaturase)
MVIGGFIHDVSTFINEHPGGAGLIRTRLGRDATTAFYGGVYDHSNGASNVLSEYRVGCIEGGYEVESSKKYSALIEQLKESGAEGVSGKAGDLGGPARKNVVVKGDPANKGKPVEEMPKAPVHFDTVRLTGGLGHYSER